MLPHPCCAAHPWAGEAGVLETGQGPLHTFGYLRDGPRGPFVAYARGPAYGRRPAHGEALLHGTAADVDRAHAGRKAVLELLERGCAFLRPRAPLRYGSPRELGSPDADHGTGTRTDTGITTDADASHTPRWWVEARSLCDDRIRHVDADRYVLASCGGRGDSTGLAVARDLAGAVGHGLREAVERDAVRAMTEGRLPVRACTADTPYADALRRDGWTVEAVRTTHLGFPVAVCAATRASGPTVGGSAAGTRPVHAVESATAEAFMKSLAWVARSEGARGATRTGGGRRAVRGPGAGAMTRGPGTGRPVSVRAAGVHGFRLSEAVVFGEPPEPLTGGPARVLAAAGGDAVLVDRGNPLLDALGLRATHVLLRLPAPSPVPPHAQRNRRLEELLR
ncbi:YcaO-like family protein [Streptomyces sp. NPDC101191]|uniref:YcaO-like family protein n=1 Tax=Streptomyces sp. NPDC101191 TaxID=3366126 RepID=UPI0038018687